MSASALRVQKRASDPLELEFQVVMNFPVWVLGPELGVSEKALHPLNYQTQPLETPSPEPNS